MTRMFPRSIVKRDSNVVPAMILNLNGILFAVQVVLLLFVGPYADYGNWRAPFLLSTSTSNATRARADDSAMAVIQNACIFGFAGLTQPSQWQAANALYVTGNIGESGSSRVVQGYS